MIRKRTNNKIEQTRTESWSAWERRWNEYGMKEERTLNEKDKRIWNEVGTDIEWKRNEYWIKEKGTLNTKETNMEWRRNKH